MKELRKELVLMSFIGVLLITGCGNTTEKTENPSDTVQVGAIEEDWSQLFIRQSGWFGGDGIFGIPMDGREYYPATEETVTLFTFGDTMIGEHDGKTLDPDRFYMVNNSVGILEGNKPDPSRIEFHYDKDENGDPKPLFIPNSDHSKPGDYYWLGDGFVNVASDSSLNIYAYRIHEIDTAGKGGFAFEQVGVDLITIPRASAPPFTDHVQIKTPLFDKDTETTFGSAIFVNTEWAGAPNPDGYIYTYAVSKLRGVKGLIVGRAKAETYTDFSTWTFYDGSGWDKDMMNSAMIAEHVSNEMSVSPLPDGSILLVYQFMTMGKEVVVQKGESLVGPFEERKTIFIADENDRDSNYFSYNAKAYPHLSPEGHVLLSYNVNSFDFWNDILEDPNLYRPRFVQWKVD